MSSFEWKKIGNSIKAGLIITATIAAIFFTAQKNEYHMPSTS